MSGPYEFGDVVDGYRWTVLGWEPVEGSEPAASAALQHALGNHLERPAVTHHARHTSATARTSASTSTDPEPVETQALPSGEPLAATSGQAADGIAAEATPPVPASAVPVAAEPQRRWTPVGWEVIEPAEPVEEFADVVAAAPSAPPLEADDDPVDPTAETSDEEPVLDLREPVALARPVAPAEPPAGWYPG